MKESEVDFKELLFMVVFFIAMMTVLPIRFFKEIIEESVEHFSGVRKMGTRLVNRIKKMESIEIFLVLAMIYLSTTLILMVFLKDGL